MSNNKTIVLTLLVASVGLYSATDQIGGYYLGLFSEMQYIPVIILFLLTIVFLSIGIDTFRSDHIRSSLIPGITGLALCSFVVFRIIVRATIENSKTVLTVGNMAGARNVLEFKFRENGKFSFAEIDMLGRTVYYGSYIKRGDTLQILSSNYSGPLRNFPQTGEIVNDTVYWKGFDVMLVDSQ